MYILIISGLFNVGCDLLFVCAFKMDVKGVAIATVISQFVSAFLTIGWFIINKNGFVRLKLQELKVSKKELLDILRIGLPACLLYTSDAADE